MKAPSFWQRRNLLAFLFWPLSLMYGFVVWVRFKISRPYQSSVPVICVGNLTVGGSGKTPFSLFLCQYLKDKGFTAHFLSRGYKGSLNGPSQVNFSQHSADEVGDEPLLLAQHAPTWIAKSRVAGLKAVEKSGADIIIMDDGFQNPTVFKDVSFIVVDGHYKFGNRFCLPAGPLREFTKSGFSRAQGMIVMEGDFEDTILPTLSCSFKPQIQDLAGQKVVAFAGIGHPQKFFDTVHRLKADLVETISFPDHHSYDFDDIEDLLHLAQKHQAQLVTTAKDMVKLPVELKDSITVVDIDVVCNDTDLLDEILMPALEK